MDPSTLTDSYDRPVDGRCQDPVQITAPANDLAAIVSQAEPGTCFTLAAGEYRFHNVVPKDGMSFIGAGRDEVRVLGSNQTENAFHGTADQVTIARMTLSGFQGTGGEKRQEQGAIRGTRAIWASDAGEMATHWLIEDVRLADNFATGVFLGDHFTVRNSVIENNGVTGLGGSELVGGLIEGNIVRNNGDLQATGYLANGGGMKFTQTLSPNEPLVVRGNEIHDNSGIGVWCDIACNGFHVIGNYIHDQGSRAVMFELSKNAVIRDNLMVNTNGWSDYKRDFNAAAITVGESSDVVIENNYIDGAVSGVIIRQTERPRRPQESFLDSYEGITFVSSKVDVRSNVVVNTRAMGISLGTTGFGLITAPGTIRFENNIYDNPSSMDFWWASGNRYSFADWRASGRDVANGTVPPRPSWPLDPFFTEASAADGN
ncbi:MAG: right-handed parallel beta-helix repeat-containing protein [Actinomycetota bacterium]